MDRRTHPTIGLTNRLRNSSAANPANPARRAKNDPVKFHEKRVYINHATAKLPNVKAGALNPVDKSITYLGGRNSGNAVEKIILAN